MFNKDLVLGIDTSNYTTSVSVTNSNGDILCDFRKVLSVKAGEKGLRQSDALFQHVLNLPELLKNVFIKINGESIAAVAASDKPRPVEGSYMPVFNGGLSSGSIIASSLNVPFYTFSHQEGHIEAVKYFSRFKDESELIIFHLSGGTCEILTYENENIQIIGGSKDISIGQLFDRVGVGLGLYFPAGESLDNIALNQEKSNILKKINSENLWFNLSGIETKCLLNLSEIGLVSELFYRISNLLISTIEQVIAQTGIDKILFIGGVAESKYIRSHILATYGDKVGFGEKNLSKDNGVGISLLGGKKIWQ